MLRNRALRLVLALWVVWAATACGSGPPGGGPPLAWVESGSDRVWMAYSSYCWGQTCADYAQPTERGDVPVVRSTLGSKMVFHLGFDPTSIGLEIPTGGEALKLAGRGRERTWIVDRSALLVLNATDAADEQASYVVEVTLGTQPSSPRAVGGPAASLIDAARPRR